MAHRRTLTALLGGLALTTPAASWAQAYNATPAVSVAPDGPGATVLVHASMDIAAPPSAVWATLTDCAGAPRFTPGLMSCTIVQRGPGWEIREHRLKGPIFHPVVLNIFRLDFDLNKRLGFRRTGGDWKRSDGEWTLTPLSGGKGTHVTYVVHFAIDAPIPAGAMRDGVRKGLPKSLIALRAESVRRAAHS